MRDSMRQETQATTSVPRGRHLGEPFRSFGNSPAVRAATPQSGDDFWSSYEEQARIRHAQARRRREERQAAREEREARRIRENSMKIGIMGGFFFGCVALSVMTRLGDDLLSSILYGMLLGAFMASFLAVLFTMLEATEWWQSMAGTAPYVARTLEEDEDEFVGLGNVAASVAPSRHVQTRPVQSRPAQTKTTARQSLAHTPARPVRPQAAGPVASGETRLALAGEADFLSFMSAIDGDIASEDDDIVVSEADVVVELG